MAEEFSTVDDLINRLIEGDRHPLVFTPFPGSLQNFCNPIRIISCLNSSLPFRTDRHIDRVRLKGRSLIRKVGKGDEGVIRISINLKSDGLTILSEKLNFYTTACIALEAYRIKCIFSFYQFILLLRTPQPR